MTFLVYTLGGGPVAHAHIVCIELSDKLHDLCIHDLSGRSDGELLSSDSDPAIGGRVREIRSAKAGFLDYGCWLRDP